MDIPAYLKALRASQDGHGFWAGVPRTRLGSVLRELKGMGLFRLSAISGVDTGKAIEVIYHVPLDHRTISLRVSLPRERPEIGTVTGIYPSAHLYERELMEMLGVKVSGHPDPRPLFLCEDSPRTPLRKQLIEGQGSRGGKGAKAAGKGRADRKG
jgi:membrane-bound hydrogenase subunit beta